MATETLNIIVHSKKTGKGVKKQSTALQDLKKLVTTLAVAYGALRTAQKAVEFLKFGAQIGRTAKAFDNLASAAGTSGTSIVKSIQTASQFTIDKMTAMRVANRAMIMDVAETPEQFERLAKVAVTLGRAMGQDAVKSIDDFVTAAGRQSRLIADNLGLIVSTTTAQERYAKQLGKTTDELTEAEKKQAFLNEMLFQGEKKITALGDGVRDAAGDWEALNAALKDAVARQAQVAGEWLRVGGLADALNTSAEAFDLLNKAAGEAGEGIAKSARGASAQLSLIKEAIIISQDWQKDEDDLRATIEEGNRALWDRETAFEEVGESAYNYGDSLDELIDREGDAAASVAFQKHLDKIREAADDARSAMLDFSEAYTDTFRDRAETAEGFAENAEDIETKHQEELAKIRKKGQSYAIKIDEAAEWDKLATLERRLEIALQRETEYTDKTSLATRMAKTLQIEQLRKQIAEQSGMLDSYNAGTLIKKGQNVTALVAAEKERYAEELRLLEESRIEQEAEQKRSLGRMLLQHWETWATLNKIGADEMMNMRLKISKEYGLITEAGARSARIQAENWDILYGKADAFFDRVMKRYNELPSEKVIRIRYELATPSLPGPGGGEFMQHGGVGMGRWDIVGERGPEMRYNPMGSRILPANVSRSVTINQTNNVGDARAAAMLQMQNRQRVRRAYERSMR